MYLRKGGRIMKARVLACSLALAISLSGCGFTYEMNENGDAVVDYNGEEYVVQTHSLKAYLDQLLESVDIPNGGTTDELKQFVYDAIGTVGIDVNDLDFSAEEAEKAIKDALTEKGIDADVDLSEFESDNQEVEEEDGD